MQMNILW